MNSDMILLIIIVGSLLAFIWIIYGLYRLRKANKEEAEEEARVKRMYSEEAHKRGW